MRGFLFKRCKHPKSQWSRCPHSWTIVVSLGTDPETGRRRQHWETVRGTKSDANRRLAELIGERYAGALISRSSITLGEYLQERWLPHLETSRGLRPTTASRYRGLITKYIVPSLGNVPLSDLEPLQIQHLLDRMLAKGLAPRTVLQAFRVLSAALRQAVQWRLIKVNAAGAVQPPRPRRPKLVVPDGSQVSRLVQLAEGGPYHIPLLLAATTGLRRGEVLGLRWRDVDLDARIVRVTATLQRARTGYELMDPKTDQARRAVALPPSTVAALRQYKRAQTERRLLLGEAWVDSDYVCDRGDGQPIRPETLTNAFRRLARKVGLPQARLHDLRHAFAKQLLEAGVHPRVAAEMLGHYSAAFTMDTYQTDIAPRLQREAAEAIDRVMRSGK